VVIFGIIELKELKEHEETDPIHLVQIQRRIEQDGLLKNPIIVDKKTKIILDGHHRYNSLKNLNCSKIAVYFVDYSSSEIKVKSRKKRKIVTKRDVINAGLSENKLPPKTSRHIIPKKPLNLCISLKELR
jgi:ParB-like chromosome segregation protein Spo0J